MRDFFDWCDQGGIGTLADIEAVHIAAWVEQLTKEKAAQTVKQRLAAVRALFDYLVIRSPPLCGPATVPHCEADSTPRMSTMCG